MLGRAERHFGRPHSTWLGNTLVDPAPSKGNKKGSNSD